MKYELDIQAAKKADSGTLRIKEKGKYIGKFTRAEALTARSGTEGIGFDFVSNEGARARFSLYTIKSDGDKLLGFNQLMAILTCLQIRGLGEPQMRMARIYDMDMRAEVDKEIPQFIELLDKPIGLLIRMEEYEKQSGGYAWRVNLANPFQADTELMATEILTRKTVPQMLPKVLMELRDRELKNKSSAPDGGFETARPATVTQVDLDDEDVPF